MSDVIRRKILAATPPPAEGAPGADRGWRLALARATRDAMGLDLEFRQLTITRASLAEILDVAPDRALIGLLDGPHGGLGVIMLAPVVTAALIEMQTVGRLASAPAVARKPTRIDAAMVAGVIDRALAGLEEVLAEEADLIWAGGFRYASHLEDARPLGLLLEEDAYRILSAEVAMANGARRGQVILILPASGRGDRPAACAPVTEGQGPSFAEELGAQVLLADCQLDGVVGRLTLPLRQIMGLQVGEVLALPLAAIDAVAVEAADGRRLATARLGQNRGMRALKILDTGAAQKPAAKPTPKPVPVAAALPVSAELPADWRAAG